MRVTERGTRSKARQALAFAHLFCAGVAVLFACGLCRVFLSCDVRMLCSLPSISMCGGISAVLVDCGRSLLVLLDIGV